MTVKRLSPKFRYHKILDKRGRKSTFDEDHPGRPNEVTTSEMFKKNPRYSDK